MKNIDVLNLEWSFSERDAHIVAPVLAYLEEQGLKCVSADIFNGLEYLCRYRPKILLISNFGGAIINDSICQLANKLGIKVVSLISEGNLRESSIEQMTWGNNKNKVAYFDLYLLWSERSRNLVNQYYPEINDRLRVTGHTGMDRYSIFPKYSKNLFLENEFPQRELSTKIVGLAGWGFELFCESERYNSNKDYVMDSYGTSQVEFFRQDFVKIKEFYRKVINNNPDTVFILRRHPGIDQEEFCEFNELLDCGNVYFSQPREDKYKLQDLISVSDVWGGYETTTNLEAWLMGKDTFLVNPSGSDFIRDALFKGSVVYEDRHSFELYINDGFSHPSVTKENQAIGFRKDIIKSVIGYSDGLNYQRAGEEILTLHKLVSHYPSYNNLDVLEGQALRLFKQKLLNIDFLAKFFNLRCRDNNHVKELKNDYIQALGLK
jgi:hypothetical protein